jgi:hypothetical protein
VNRRARSWPLLALPLLAAGCASAQVAPAAAEHGAAVAAPAGAAADAAPPETATMVCGEEIRSKVQAVLALPAEPTTSSTWADGLYTCRYALPEGPMTLTVRFLHDRGQAGAALDADRGRTAGAVTLDGLGERAWGTPAGTAVVLKDAQILTVDTTALPEVFGANQQRRSDLAYEVASDVLGCWTGDE